MKMFVAGKWVDKSEKIEVRNPFDGSVVDTVPKADAGDVDKALAARGRRRRGSCGPCRATSAFKS